MKKDQGYVYNMAWKRGFTVSLVNTAFYTLTDLDERVATIDEFLKGIKQPPVSDLEKQWVVEEATRIAPFLMEYVQKGFGKGQPT